MSLCDISLWTFSFKKRNYLFLYLDIFAEIFSLWRGGDFIGSPTIPMDPWKNTRKRCCTTRVSEGVLMFVSGFLSVFLCSTRNFKAPDCFVFLKLFVELLGNFIKANLREILQYFKNELVKIFGKSQRTGRQYSNDGRLCNKSSKHSN